MSCLICGVRARSCGMAGDDFKIALADARLPRTLRQIFSTNLDNVMEDVLSKITLVKFKRDAIVGRPGDAVDRLLIVGRGALELRTNSNEREVRTLYVGDVLGKSQLQPLINGQSISIGSSTTIAAVDTEGYSFSFIDILDLQARNSAFGKILEESCNASQANSRWAKMSAAIAMGTFQTFDEKVARMLKEMFGEKMSQKLREEVTRRVKVNKYTRGYTIAKQGDPSDTLFFVSKGALDIIQDGVLLHNLGEGEVVGERALLEPGSKCQADVVAVVTTECYSLDQDDLQDLKEKNPEFGRVVVSVGMLDLIGMPALTSLDDAGTFVAPSGPPNRYAAPASIAMAAMFVEFLGLMAIMPLIPVGFSCSMLIFDNLLDLCMFPV